MKSKFTEEFKIQAVKQIAEEGYTFSSVSERISVSSNSLYNWLKRYGENSEQYLQSSEQEARIKVLEKELKRSPRSAIP